jgi:NAD(P)-dependent dehydrogenase (short-subunit alcohol dehydrogenase family)
MEILNGKKVFITGGAKRLGAEIALAFANNGAAVAIHYNNSEWDAKKLVKKIINKGNKACAVRADVGKISQIEHAVNKGAESLGGLDILINNAAIFYKTPLIETSESQWDDFMDINLRAPFFFAKFAAPFLASGCPTLVGKNIPASAATARRTKKKAGHPATLPHGRIINIADTYGTSPAAGYVPYGVSKAGLIALTKGLAKELASLVLVNCVCPGVISSEVDRVDKLTELTKLVREGKRGAMNATLLKRSVDIKDIVNTVMFLAVNNSMTGQAICVDGGKNV